MEQTDIDELRMRFRVIPTVLMKIKVLWGFMSCRLVNIYWHSKGCFTDFCKAKQSIRVKLLDPEEEGTTLLRNFLHYSPVDAAQSPRRLEFSQPAFPQSKVYRIGVCVYRHKPLGY